MPVRQAHVPRAVERADTRQADVAGPGRKLRRRDGLEELPRAIGLQPDRESGRLVSVAPLELPSWVGELRLTGLHAFGRQWEVRIEGGDVRVEAA